MTELVDVVEVYRSLDGSFAIRRVQPPSLERSESVMLKDVEFVINAPAQAAARKSGVRSAHAFARGEPVEPLSDEFWEYLRSRTCVVIRYHHDRGFYRADTDEIITACRLLHCEPDGVTAVL